MNILDQLAEYSRLRVAEDKKKISLEEMKNIAIQTKNEKLCEFAFEKALKKVAPKYYPDFSRTVSTTYWMNHCEHCGMKQGDFGLHQESDAPFFPISTEQAQLLAFLEVNEPMQCTGDGYGNYSSNMDELFQLFPIID